MQAKNILITGGAGFIGSNLAEALLADKRVGLVRVVDDLSNGFRRNIEAFMSHPRFEFVEGSVEDYDLCERACQGIDLIAHQAALGSVPRSIKNPLRTNTVNINGTLNVFTAAKEAGIRRVVFAASSSTYGDSAALPKREDVIGKPLSPYAVTKLVNELYADVYASLYDFNYIGLRYFNVFGPKQDPYGAYAAVIPLFAKAILNGERPTINGDGSFSRDFTYIDNVVQANVKALFTENEAALNHIYNVACGGRTTLLELFDALKEEAGVEMSPILGPERPGDIPHSHADIAKIRERLGYVPEVSVTEGIRKAFGWYRELFGVEV